VTHTVPSSLPDESSTIRIACPAHTCRNAVLALTFLGADRMTAPLRNRFSGRAGFGVFSSADIFLLLVFFLA